MSITTRITLLCLLVFSVGFYLFVRSEVEDTTQRYREATEEPLVDFANVLATQVAQEWSRGDTSFSSLRTALQDVKQLALSARIYDFDKKSIDLRVYITNERGVVLFDSDGAVDEGKDYSGWLDVSRTLRGEYGARNSRDPKAPSASIMYVAAPIRVSGMIQGSLTIAKSNATANQFILAAQRNIWSLGLTLLGAGFLVTTILALYVSRPLRRLIVYVKQVRDGKRDTTPLHSRGEIGELAQAFEEMREALEGKKYIEKYVQTLTHELKSPVTAIKGAVEVLHGAPSAQTQRHFLDNIDREVERIRGLADQLLVLSSLQTQRGMTERQEVIISGVLDEVLQGLQSELDARRIVVHRDELPELSLSGNRFWITEALRNVVHNAVEFSPDGEVVQIRACSDDGTVLVIVQDRGPGVPEWALAKVTDQFFSLPRPHSKRRSSGLGLSIVKEVMQLHQGSLIILNRDGGGAEVRLEFLTGAEREPE
jgi:two-component system sensor histidine kinase CreC